MPPPPTRRYVVRPGPRRRPWLPVAGAPGGATDLLADAAGAPVWPVAEEADRAALSAVAALFGAALRPAGVAPARAGRDGAGMVVGLGGCGAEARLYAHLTGRGWRTAPTAEDLGSPLPDVVVLDGPVLDPLLVQRLLGEPAGRVTGIVWGRTRAELRRRVLVASAARVLDGAVARRRTDVSLSMTGGARRLGDLEILGPGASRDALRGALTQGAGVLTLFVHGDGVSMSLSPELALCARTEPSAADDPRLAPACVATGRCATLRTSVEEAFAGHVVAPGEVAARVLVMPTCYGAFLGTPACDASWALLPRLLATPRVGAVVSPVEPSILAADVVAQLLSAPLARGVPVGRALAAYEQDLAVARLGHRMLLFGDPDTRAAPPPATAGPGPPPRRPRVVRPAARPGEHGELAVLGLVARFVRDGGEGARTAADAQAALAAYRDAPGEGSAAAMRAALLAHIGTMKARPYGPWLAAAALQRRREQAPCPGCEWPVRPFDADVRGAARRLVTCPRCGVVADWPAAGALRLTAAPPSVELGLDAPWEEGWDGAIYVVPASARDARMRAWPRTAAGAPERTITLPAADWPAGPVEVRAVAIVGTTLLSAGARTRADVAAPPPAPSPPGA